MKKIVLILSTFCLFATLYGQNRSASSSPARGGINRAGNSGGGVDKDSGVIVRDTSDYFYFYSDNLNLTYPLADTTLSEDIIQYNPTRLAFFDYGDLGNLGTPLVPLVWHQNILRRGFDVGLHQFDLYNLYTDDLKFYKITQSFSRAYFSQGTDQENIYFKGELSRNVGPNTNLTVDYKRLNNQGAYAHQKAEHTALQFGIWTSSKNKKYNAFISAGNNTNDIQDNGGIDLTTIQQDTLNPVLISVQTQSPLTKHTSREVAYTQHYQLNNRLDSVKQTRRAFSLYHQALFRQSTYKFHDATLAADSSYYQDYQIDSRGLRQYTTHNQFENTFKVQTYKLKKADSTNIQVQNDLLEVGLTHLYHKIYQEPKDTSINNLFLLGKYSFTPNSRVKINLNGQLGVLQNAGDYMVNGELFFGLKKVGQLRAFATQQLYSPTLLQYRTIVNTESLWQNDFKKSLATTLGGTYSLPKLGFEGTFRYNLLNNHIYHDANGQPTQASSAANILQIIVKQRFKFGIFRSENEVTLQQSTADYIRLPQLYSTHNLYITGKPFKRSEMIASLGFDLHLFSPFKPYYYFPLTGQFQLQEDQETKWQPMLDGFLAFQVRTFRFFVRYENVVPILSNQYYYQVAGYAQNPFNLRLGLSWRFVD